MPKLTTCLWFDTDGEDAARLYTSVFPNSRITELVPYPEGTQRAGQTMVVAFELDGAPFVALNGGPQFTFDEAISIQIDCASQEEVDHYWDGLLAGGGQESMCGWLKDRYGMSWQVVPTRLKELLAGPDAACAQRVNAAMMHMRRLDIATLEAAAAA